MADTSIAYKVRTLRQLLDVIERAEVDLDAPLKVEVTGFINGGMLLSQRQNMASVLVSPKGKTILRAAHPEAWRLDDVDTEPNPGLSS
jgi:hypothetical protein